jgi:hypothetical protein
MIMIEKMEKKDLANATTFNHFALGSWKKLES